MSETAARETLEGGDRTSWPAREACLWEICLDCATVTTNKVVNPLILIQDFCLQLVDVVFQELEKQITVPTRSNVGHVSF